MKKVIFSKTITLASQQDLSVNFFLPSGQESRYVRRSDDYFICYISSHDGCNKSCRFCHLTQTGQTSFNEARIEDMLEQARLVFLHYKTEVLSGRQSAVSRIHFNWMARGEPLASSVVTGQWAELTSALTGIALEAGVIDLKFNISSIFPVSKNKLNDVNVLDAFDSGVAPVIFYSLYSLDRLFRKRWLPKARDPHEVLAQLAEWQLRTGGELVLHWAMIEGENDDEATMSDIINEVNAHGLKARFNLVRYNPHSAEQGQEPEISVLDARLLQIYSTMQVPGSRIVPRVGFDVKASCGMFVA